MIQISLTGSVWTTIAVSVERYCTVCLSMRYNTVQHLFYTLPILAFSFVFNIPGSDDQKYTTGWGWWSDTWVGLTLS